MDKQLLIVMGREFGSGGREIAKELARRFRLPVYDKSMLEKIALEEGYDAEVLRHYDEKPRNIFTSRHVRGFTNSPEENVAQMQFNFLREHAEKGESFLVLGRCGEEILKDFPGMVSIFVLSDIGFKKARTMARDNTPEDEALALMARKDLQRKYYHNQYCSGKWGDSRNYDLCINSARLGIKRTTDVLEDYIKARMEELSR